MLETWGMRPLAPDNFLSTEWKRVVSYEEKLSHLNSKGVRFQQVLPTLSTSSNALTSCCLTCSVEHQHKLTCFAEHQHTRSRERTDTSNRGMCLILLQVETTRHGRKGFSATWATITEWSWTSTKPKTSATSTTTLSLSHRCFVERERESE